jgi:hypothetical protein
MNGCDGIVERRDSAFYKSFAIRIPPDLILLKEESIYTKPVLRRIL